MPIAFTKRLRYVRCSEAEIEITKVVVWNLPVSIRDLSVFDMQSDFYNINGIEEQKKVKTITLCSVTATKFWHTTRKNSSGITNEQTRNVFFTNTLQKRASVNK